MKKSTFGNTFGDLVQQGSVLNQDPPNGKASTLTVSTVSDTQINLAWVIGSTNHTGHKIYISIDKVNWTLKGTVLGAISIYSATGLTAGTLYYFKVAAYLGIETAATKVNSEITWPSELTDGNTFAQYEPLAKGGNKNSFGAESVWFDMMYGNNTLGAEQASGAIYANGVYIITATQTNYFFTGCKVGDIFVCPVVTTCDQNNKVRRYTGVHLTQITSTKLPLYQVFDGVDDTMTTPLDAVLIQPEFVFAIGKQITWTSADTLWDGKAANTGKLQQYPAPSPKLRIYGGTLLSDNSNLAVNTWGIIRFLLSGVNSKLQINTTTALAGDAGADKNMSGFTLGSVGGGGAEWSNVQFKKIIIRKSATGEAAIYSYMEKKLIHKNLTVIGDSISAPSTVAWIDKVRQSIGYVGFNHSVAGNSIMLHMDAQVLASANDNADIIIIALGVNDNNAGDMAALQAKIETNIDALRVSNPKADIYYSNVLPCWTNNTGATEVEKGNIRTAIAAACLSKSVECWDTYTVPWIVASDTNDGLHPGGGGLTKIANKMIEKLNA